MWFYRHNLKPFYFYSCSFRDLGDFWTEIARRTCDKEALDGVLDRFFRVFVILELQELLNSPAIFQYSISLSKIMFCLASERYRHMLAYKNVF